MKTLSFEKFPLWMVLSCNAVGLAIYVIGIYIMSHLGIVWGIVFAVYCIWMEWRLLFGSCRSCYYYGKRCGFGKGRLCSFLFPGITEKDLSKKQISWWDVVPDFMVSIIPLVVGIIVLIRSFSWLMLILIVILVGLGSIGTGLIRGQIACKYCRQREIGCPAEELFSKREQGK